MCNSCEDLSKINAVILHSEGAAQVEIVRQAHSDEQVVGLWLHGRGITESCGWKCDEGGVSLRF